MKIYKTKDQYKIGFLENTPEEAPPISTRDHNDNHRARKEFIGACQKLRHNTLNYTDPTRRASSVRSADLGAISNDGGSSTQLNCENSQLIFDNQKKNKVSGLETRERTLDSKSKMQQDRIAKDKEWKEQNSPQTLQDDVLTNKRSADSYGVDGSKGVIPRASISMFDKGEYDRLPAKTEGESLDKKSNSKDSSWKESGKAITSRDLNNNMLNKLSTSSEKSSSNLQRSAADKLFDMLKNRFDAKSND